VFFQPIDNSKKGTIAVYDTVTEALVLKKMDITNLKFYLTYLVSSNTQLFNLFFDKVNSFTLFEIDLNLINGTELKFSEFGTLTETTLSTSSLNAPFTSKSLPGATWTEITTQPTENKADALIASYGTPAFKTFPEDTLTL